MIRRRLLQDEAAPRTRTLPGEGIPGPPEWMQDAACAQIGGDEWFPERGENPRAAKRICRICCPVRDACAAYIFELDPSGCTMPGVWGGLTQGERRVIGKLNGAA